jgi:hypothetical protein
MEETSFFVTNNQYDKDGKKIKNKFVNPLGSEVTLYFNEPVHLGNSKKGYEIYVKRAGIVYCVSNVSSALKNNKLTYTYKDSVTNNDVTRTYIYDDGLYSLENINFKLGLFTSQSGNGGDGNLIYFKADNSSSRIYVTFNKIHVSIDASATDSILLSLGFTITQGSHGDGKIGDFDNKLQYDISDGIAQLNPIQSYIIATNISTGNYLDCNVSNALEAVPIGKTEAFSLSEFDSNNVTKADVNVRNIDRLIISLLDNHGNLVDMNTSGGIRKPEAWWVEITIAEKK